MYILLDRKHLNYLFQKFCSIFSEFHNEKMNMKLFIYD